MPGLAAYWRSDATNGRTSPPIRVPRPERSARARAAQDRGRTNAPVLHRCRGSTRTRRAPPGRRSTATSRCESSLSTTCAAPYASPMHMSAQLVVRPAAASDAGLVSRNRRVLTGSLGDRRCESNESAQSARFFQLLQRVLACPWPPSQSRGLWQNVARHAQADYPHKKISTRLRTTYCLLQPQPANCCHTARRSDAFRHEKTSPEDVASLSPSGARAPARTVRCRGGRSDLMALLTVEQAAERL